jgi:chromosome segregation ATPase
VELYNAFEEARKGHPSERVKVGGMMRGLSDRLEELNGQLETKDRDLMGASSRADGLLEENRSLKKKLSHAKGSEARNREAIQESEQVVKEADSLRSQLVESEITVNLLRARLDKSKKVKDALGTQLAKSREAAKALATRVERAEVAQASLEKAQALLQKAWEDA